MSQNQQQAIDKFGTCPNPDCQENWDGGDILDKLKAMDLYMDKPDEFVRRVAEQAYGYTKENPKKFSKAIQLQAILEDHKCPPDNVRGLRLVNSSIEPTLIQCPKCMNVWNAETGEHYPNLLEAKIAMYGPNKEPITSERETSQGDGNQPNGEPIPDSTQEQTTGGLQPE